MAGAAAGPGGAHGSRPGCQGATWPGQILGCLKLPAKHPNQERRRSTGACSARSNPGSQSKSKGGPCRTCQPALRLQCLGDSGAGGESHHRRHLTQHGTPLDLKLQGAGVWHRDKG